MITKIPNFPNYGVDKLGYVHRNIIIACKNNLVRYGFKWKYYEGVETK